MVGVVERRDQLRKAENSAGYQAMLFDAVDLEVLCHLSPERWSDLRHKLRGGMRCNSLKSNNSWSAAMLVITALEIVAAVCSAFLKLVGKVWNFPVQPAIQA